MSEFIDTHLFNGMQVIVVPDDDKRMENIPLDCIGVDNGHFYVRESLWPQLKKQLITLIPEKQS